MHYNEFLSIIIVIAPDNGCQKCVGNCFEVTLFRLLFGICAYFAYKLSFAITTFGKFAIFKQMILFVIFFQILVNANMEKQIVSTN